MAPATIFTHHFQGPGDAQTWEDVGAPPSPKGRVFAFVLPPEDQASQASNQGRGALFRLPAKSVA